MYIIHVPFFLGGSADRVYRFVFIYQRLYLGQCVWVHATSSVAVGSLYFFFYCCSLSILCIYYPAVTASARALPITLIPSFSCGPCNVRWGWQFSSSLSRPVLSRFPSSQIVDSAAAVGVTPARRYPQVVCLFYPVRDG